MDKQLENAILEQGKRIRALHEIISRVDLSFDEQIDETLHLGCAILGTEIGKLGRQNPDENQSEFLNTVVQSDLPVKRGMILPLDKTFCQITFSSPETISISHVSESKYSTHPAAAFLGMESYIGCSIDVHGKKFGTVNFSNREPVKTPFTDADIDFVNLIASWISSMMERKIEAEELKVAKEVAEKASDEKSQFLANMSHEIRTPLTAIIGYSDIAVGHNQTEEQRLNALKKIKGSGKHLLHLINDILDFSKIEAGELYIDNALVNLIDVLDDIESIMQGQAYVKGLAFSIVPIFPLPQRICTDALKIKQVLLNLCSNAIKFTHSGHVKIKVNYVAEERELVFRIIDSGIGLTNEQTALIFQPYKQADKTTEKKFGGTGLGLSLSKRIMELLGGDLTVSSVINEGSTFTAKMGLDDDSINEQTHFLSSVEDNALFLESEIQEEFSGSVLVVGDDPFSQDLLGMYLEDLGLTVSFADDGEEAIPKCFSHQYDAVMIEMQMSSLSGVELTKKLRAKNFTAPIVMLSASSTVDDKNMCEEAGSSAFISKPIDTDRLAETMEQLLSKR